MEFSPINSRILAKMGIPPLCQDESPPNAATPEMSLGVVQGWRGGGIGSRLLDVVQCVMCVRCKVSHSCHIP